MTKFKPLQMSVTVRKSFFHGYVVVKTTKIIRRQSQLKEGEYRRRLNYYFDNAVIWQQLMWKPQGFFCLFRITFIRHRFLTLFIPIDVIEHWLFTNEGLSVCSKLSAADCILILIPHFGT
jgi:hypothetical protein